jgi:hypothetical protein
MSLYEKSDAAKNRLPGRKRMWLFSFALGCIWLEPPFCAKLLEHPVNSTAF